jgi:hypothetical protein
MTLESLDLTIAEKHVVKFLNAYNTLNKTTTPVDIHEWILKRRHLRGNLVSGELYDWHDATQIAVMSHSAYCAGYMEKNLTTEQCFAANFENFETLLSSPLKGQFFKQE